MAGVSEFSEAVRQGLAEANPDAVVFDDCDDALVGWAQQQFHDALAVYDYDKLVKVFEAQGMGLEGAVEWVEFNVVGLWAGEGTPLILHRPELPSEVTP